MAETMRAAVITKPGDPNVLDVREVARPEAPFGHVRVRVRAAGLNRADLLQRAGHYPAPPRAPADIPGIEFAGEVESLGEAASLWSIGDSVFGIAGGGAHAEYVVAHERALARVPTPLSWLEAASVPEAFITAHDAMLVQAGLRPGETVLIHAVGSGVGLAAVQLARAVNAFPFGTARTAEKIERAYDYGLDDGLTLTSDLSPLGDWVREWWTGGAGADVVVDLVGGPYVAASVDVLAARGRLMCVGTVGGPVAEIPLGKLLGKRATITGTVLRARPLEERIEATLRFSREVLPLFDTGVLRHTLETVFELDDVREAHRYLESNRSFGKVVLSVAPDIVDDEDY